MADEDMLYLIQWEDRYLSVIEKNKIVQPKKQTYEEQELITAKYGKNKSYEAVICEVHPNRKYLLSQAKLPPKFTYVEAKRKQAEQKHECQMKPPVVTKQNQKEQKHELQMKPPAVTKQKQKADLEQSQKEMELALLKRPRESSPDPLQQQVTELSDEVKRLKKRVRELEKGQARCQTSPAHQRPDPQIPEEQSRPSLEPVESSQPLESLQSAELYNGYTLSHLRDSIVHCDTVFQCCHELLMKLFGKEYILSHSVSGQKANSTTVAKPKFDGRLYSALKMLIKEKFSGLKDAEITIKVQAVQKKYKKK